MFFQWLHRLSKAISLEIGIDGFTCLKIPNSVEDRIVTVRFPSLQKPFKFER